MGAAERDNDPDVADSLQRALAHPDRFGGHWLRARQGPSFAQVLDARARRNPRPHDTTDYEPHDVYAATVQRYRGEPVWPSEPNPMIEEDQ